MCPVLHLYVLFITDQYQKRIVGRLYRDTLTETRAVTPLKHLVINLSATSYDIDITYFPSTVSVILDWYVPLQTTLV
jgi:hypothetical protein